MTGTLSVACVRLVASNADGRGIDVHSSDEEWLSPRGRAERERQQQQAAFEALMALADDGGLTREDALAALGLGLRLEREQPADVWQAARLRRLGIDVRARPGSEEASSPGSCRDRGARARLGSSGTVDP